MSRIAFIHWAGFSRINERLRAALEATFADFDLEAIDVVDVLARDERRLAFKLATRAHAMRDYGGLLVTRRERMGGVGGCRVRTRFYFEHVRRLLSECLAGRGYAFTLQTQSFFDGRGSDAPHFVYTDHAELQTLRLPGFSPRSFFGPRWLALETALYRNAELVFTMSDATRECLVAGYGLTADRVACVGAGPSAVPDGVPARADRYARKRIVFVAARWEPKGGPELAAAFERVLRVHPDARLVIVGCEPRLSLPNCEIVGNVPLEQVARHYADASVFCVPTRREAFGIVFLEALAHGLPVVATRVGPLAEHIREGETGYLVEVGDVTALADRLERLIADPEACRRMGEAGRRLVEERYSWRRTAEEMRRHIEARL